MEDQRQFIDDMRKNAHEPSAGFNHFTCSRPSDRIKQSHGHKKPQLYWPAAFSGMVQRINILIL